MSPSLLLLLLPSRGGDQEGAIKDKTGRRTIDPNFNNLLNTKGTPLSPLGKLYASTPPLLEYDWSYSYRLP